MQYICRFSYKLFTLLHLWCSCFILQRDIEIASDLVKNSIDLSNQFRRKTSLSESFGRMLKKADYNSYSEGETSVTFSFPSLPQSNATFSLFADQIHAELCYAESLLFKAVLTFMEDENLISFVKGGLKIRSCYQSYKFC